MRKQGNRLRQNLQHDRAILRTLIDNLPDGIFLKDKESRFIFANQVVAEHMGAPDPSVLRGKTDRDFYPKEVAEALFTDERVVMETRQGSINKEESKSMLGVVRQILTTKVPIVDARGEVAGLLGITRDITERHKMEKRNLLLAAMIESSKDAIIGVGLNDEVTSWNRGAEKVFGYTADEMIGKPITPLLSPDIQSQESTLKEKFNREARSQQFEHSVQRKDGTKVYVSTTFSPIEDATGLLVGITAISRDVTDQRALQVQVIRSQRLESLGTLAAGVAHQFNNINAATKGYLDIIAQDTTLPSLTQSYVQEALKGLMRAVEITERLQGLTSAAPTGAESLRLEEEVPRLLPLFEKKLLADGISIQVDFQQTAPVRAKCTMVSFILTSLLTNSIHALLDCHTRLITLRTRSAEGFSSLEISDTGCGILPENLPRIFTPFFTTKGEWAEPKSSQSRVKGIGLSLAVCQSSVSESGGWIEVESAHQQGSTFRVWFPAGTGIA